MITGNYISQKSLATIIIEFLSFYLVIHWLVMTAWVVWQDTDFCRELWEERLYNAVGKFSLHKMSITVVLNIL